MSGATDRNAGAWRAVQAALLVLAGAFFLFSMRASLNPFLLYCVFIALLTPFREIRGYALLVTIATVLIALWVLSTAGSLLAPFFLAFVLAYILDPLADRISAHPRIGRTVAIFLILVPFLALGAVVVIFGVPELARQARDLVNQAPQLLEGARGVGKRTDAGIARFRHPLRGRAGTAGLDPGTRRPVRRGISGVAARGAHTACLGGHTRPGPRLRHPADRAWLPGPHPRAHVLPAAATTTGSWPASATFCRANSSPG